MTKQIVILTAYSNPDGADLMGAVSAGVWAKRLGGDFEYCLLRV